MGKKTISIKLDEKLIEKLDEKSRKKGKNRSDLIRSAIKEKIQDLEGKENTKIWENIPSSFRDEIRKVFECIRDYQLFKGKEPLNFEIYNRSRDLEKLISTKWQSKTDKHLKKFQKAIGMELLKAVPDTSEDPITPDRKIVLSERGEKLMKALGGGTFSPRDLERIDKITIDQSMNNGENRDSMDFNQPQTTLGSVVN